MASDKAKTNKKWTSSKDYSNNYDRIFAKTVYCSLHGPKSEAIEVLIEANQKLGCLECLKKLEAEVNKDRDQS